MNECCHEFDVTATPERVLGRGRGGLGKYVPRQCIVFKSSVWTVLANLGLLGNHFSRTAFRCRVLVVDQKEDSPPPGKQLSDPPAGPPRRQHWARSSQAIGIRSEIRDVRAKNLAVHWDSL